MDHLGHGIFCTSIFLSSEHFSCHFFSCIVSFTDFVVSSVSLSNYTTLLYVRVHVSDCPFCFNFQLFTLKYSTKTERSKTMTNPIIFNSNIAFSGTCVLLLNAICKVPMSPILSVKSQVISMHDFSSQLLPQKRY